MSLHTNFDHLRIPLQDILYATDNFAEKNDIGQGATGQVFKGQLWMHGQRIDIAARRLHDWYNGRSKVFWTEISILSRLKHPDLVSIVGFCDENDEKVIIYHKYETRRSLDVNLSNPALTWLQRLQICYHVALALRYIHYDVSRDFSVIHRHVKSSKILLTDDWKPKLSGFGLATTDSTDRRNHLLVDNFCGSSAYADPTYMETGLVSHRSDMYSFGVILFEVLCGRIPFIQVNGSSSSLVTLARLHYEKGTLDEIIYRDIREQIDPRSLSIFSEIAYACLNEQRSQRPHVDQIVKRLGKALEIQMKQETPEHSIVDLEIEDAYLKERSIVDLEVEDALFKERTIIDLEVEDAFFKGKYTEHLKIPLRDARLATDNFSEIHLIGEGGYSKVYRCKLPHIENDVVIKRILEEQSFLEEIKMLTKCKHPNIISLVGFCYESGDMILVLEYASKGSLDVLFGDTDYMNTFTWDQRIQVCLDIAHGLKYLHIGMDDKNAIIHRDIKSGNILLDENGNAKIADFGLSKLESSHKPDLHARNHEELHDIAPSYDNVDRGDFAPNRSHFFASDYSRSPPSSTYSPPDYNRIRHVINSTKRSYRNDAPSLTDLKARPNYSDIAPGLQRHCSELQHHCFELHHK